MSRQITAPTPTVVPPGTDCLTTGSCLRPANPTTVFVTAALKALEEEFDLENNPNTSAKIPLLQRAARTGARVVYHVFDINAKNNSFAPPGTDCETTGSCLVPAPLGISMQNPGY